MSEQTVNLTSILQNQVDKLTALSTLLERELQLISSREAESLMALLDEKAQLLEDIQKIDSAAEALIDQGQTYSEEDDVLTEKAKVNAICSAVKPSSEERY